MYVKNSYIYIYMVFLISVLENRFEPVLISYLAPNQPDLTMHTPGRKAHVFSRIKYKEILQEQSSKQLPKTGLNHNMIFSFCHLVKEQTKWMRTTMNNNIILVKQN